MSRRPIGAVGDEARLVARVSAELLARAHEAAQAAGEPLSALVRRAVERELRRLERVSK